MGWVQLRVSRFFHFHIITLNNCFNDCLVDTENCDVKAETITLHLHKMHIHWLTCPWRWQQSLAQWRSRKACVGTWWFCTTGVYEPIGSIGDWHSGLCQRAHTPSQHKCQNTPGSWWRDLWQTWRHWCNKCTIALQCCLGRKRWKGEKAEGSQA